MTDVRITRQSVRVLGANPLVDARIQRQSVRVLGANPLVDTRLDRQSVRVLGSNPSDVRVSRQAMNILATSPSDVRVFRQSGNILASTPSDIRVYRQAINILVKHMPNDTVGYWGAHIGTGYTAILANYNPLSWWRLDETSGTSVTDYGSLSNTGTYLGSPTLDQPGIPGHGRSTLFDGTDDQVTAPWNASYRYGTSASRSYGFWYKGTSTGTELPNTDRAFLAGSDSISAKLFAIGVDSLGKIRCYVDDNYVLVGPSLTSINDNSWHFVMLTVAYNSSTYTGRLYIDGIEEASSTAINDLGTGNPIISIGRNNRSADGYITGLIDEVVIFPTALTQPQIAEIFAAGKP